MKEAEAYGRRRLRLMVLTDYYFLRDAVWSLLETTTS